MFGGKRPVDTVYLILATPPVARSSPHAIATTNVYLAALAVLAALGVLTGLVLIGTVRKARQTTN